MPLIEKQCSEKDLIDYRYLYIRIAGTTIAKPYFFRLDLGPWVRLELSLR